MEKFVEGEYDKVELVYNSFKNAATQIVMTEQFLPIVPVEGDAETNSDYIFEPSKEEIVEQLIPKSLKTQLFKGCLLYTSPSPRDLSTSRMPSSA